MFFVDATTASDAAAAAVVIASSCALVVPCIVRDCHCNTLLSVSYLSPLPPVSPPSLD